MKKTAKTRLLAMLLLLAMVLSLVPAALAVDTGVPVSALESSTEPVDSSVEDASGNTDLKPDGLPQTPEPSASAAPSPEPSAEPEASAGPDDLLEDDSEFGTILDTGGNFVQIAGMRGISLFSSSPTLSQGKDLWTTDTQHVIFDYYDAQGGHHTSSYIWLAPYYLDGKPAFCIEPTVHVAAGMAYNADEAHAAWQKQLTAAQRYAVALAIAYGYPNTNYSTSSKDRLTAAQIESEKLLATQSIVWEIVSGQRSATAPFACANSSIEHCYSTSGYPTYHEVYRAISDAMAAHEDIPSFSAQSEADAPTYELTYDPGSGTYQTTLTDTRGVLDSYAFTSDVSGLSITRSGSKRIGPGPLSGGRDAGPGECHLHHHAVLGIVAHDNH